MGDIKFTEEQYKAMVGATISELNDIMNVSLKQRAKDLVKTAIGRAVRVEEPMFWPAGMLMLGLAEAREVLSGKDTLQLADPGLVKRIDEAMESHLSLWQEQYNGKVDFVDDALAGAALVKMYAQTGKDLYRDAANRIYRFVFEAPRDPEGSIIYNPGKTCNIFVDGIGQSAMFLSLYGRVFKNTEALSLAKTQLMNFRKYGMDDRSGLCYHGYCITDGNAGRLIEKKGLLGWGRAMGWLMMGLSEYCKGNVDMEIATWYRDLCGIVESYVRPDGGFSWQLQAIEGHLDTSATGMLMYAIRTGDMSIFVANTDSAGHVGSALSSCIDFGVHYQSYGNYPWGQGAALAAVSQMLGR